jgi:hypothetical protein
MGLLLLPNCAHFIRATRNDVSSIVRLLGISSEVAGSLPEILSLSTILAKKVLTITLIRHATRVSAQKAGSLDMLYSPYRGLNSVVTQESLL